jgi:hypothetical protein
MSTKKTINVTVLVDESHHGSMDTVAVRLKDKGFVLKESLAAAGVLTGSAPAAALASLSEVPGVAAVEEERTDYRTQPGASVT